MFSDLCSCSPFECSCNQSSSTNFTYGVGQLGRSPMAANTPHMDNYSPGIDTYSPQIQNINVNYVTPTTWPPSVEWSHQLTPAAFRPESSWEGWCPRQGNIPTSTDPNIPIVTSTAAIQHPSMPYAHPSTQNTVSSHAMGHQTCTGNDEQQENMFALDSFQPSDIFALDGFMSLPDESQLTAQSFGVNSANNILTVVPNSSCDPAVVNGHFSAIGDAAGDVAASRLLQCLDDIIGDCFVNESGQEIIPANMNVSMYTTPKVDFTLSQQMVPTTSPSSKTLLTTMTTTTKITSSIQERIVVNPTHQYNAEEIRTPYQSNYCQELLQYNLDPCNSLTYQPTGQENLYSIPKYNCSTNPVDNHDAYHLNSTFPTSSQSHHHSLNIPQSPSSLVSSPPTFQNLDTLETTQGSPISYSDIKYQACIPETPGGCRSPTLVGDFINCPVQNSPNYCNSELAPSRYSLPDRGSSCSQNDAGCTNYDITMYTSSFSLSTNTNSNGFRMEEVPVLPSVNPVDPGAQINQSAIHKMVGFTCHK